MRTGPCCPGKSDARRIVVGGHMIGISQLDEILQAAEGIDDQGEERVKEFLIRQLKIHNYIPPGAEEEYLVAVWREYVGLRTRDAEVKG